MHPQQELVVPEQARLVPQAEQRRLERRGHRKRAGYGDQLPLPVVESKAAKVCAQVGHSLAADLLGDEPACGPPPAPYRFLHRRPRGDDRGAREAIGEDAFEDRRAVGERLREGAADGAIEMALHGRESGRADGDAGEHQDAHGEDDDPLVFAMDVDVAVPAGAPDEREEGDADRDESGGRGHRHARIAIPGQQALGRDVPRHQRDDAHGEQEPGHHLHQDRGATVRDTVEGEQQGAGEQEADGGGWRHPPRDRVQGVEVAVHARKIDEKRHPEDMLRQSRRAQGEQQGAARAPRGIRTRGAGETSGRERQRRQDETRRGGCHHRHRAGHARQQPRIMVKPAEQHDQAERADGRGGQQHQGGGPPRHFCHEPLRVIVPQVDRAPSSQRVSPIRRQTVTSWR